MSYFAKQNLMNPRLLAVSLLSFSSSLPLFLTGGTLQAWFTHEHVKLAVIGSISLLGIPYALKFLWAPIMDYLSIPILGKRRGWIMCMQAALVLALCLLAELNPVFSTTSMLSLALVIAFFSASQDVAVDAYRADILASPERGLGSAYSIFASRIAILLSSGFALIFADHFGFRSTYYLMSAILLLAMVATYFIPKNTEYGYPSRDLIKMTLDSFRDLYQRDKIVLICLFLIFYKFGDALALQLMSNFLLGHLGFSLTEVGLAYKFVGFIAMVLGGLIGGICLIRLSIYRALLIFGLAQAFSNLMFVILAVSTKQLSLMAVSIFIENGCSGLTTTALLAWMMSLCRSPYTASQFALFSAIASLGRIGLGPVAAYLVSHVGWAQLFVWAFVLSFPGLILLSMMKNEVFTHEPLAVS